MFSSLVKAAWLYAGAGRSRMVLFYAMSVIGNTGISLQPIVLAKVINSIQGSGNGAIDQVLFWAAIYGCITLVFWLLHGPARVIERRLAFDINTNFLNSLYRKVTEMPLKWHQDHHSGDTINRINKAAHALFNFAQEQFSIIQMTIRFCVSMLVLGWYSPWALLVSLVISCFLAFIIRRFDRVLVPLIATCNEREHRLNATIFDYISNIITILTLRAQNNTRVEVANRIDAIKPSFWREISVNEWKWALVNVILVTSQAAIIGGYIAFHLWRHEAVDVGAVVAIFQSLLMISHCFYDATEVYGRLMQRHTDISGIDGLNASYAQLAKANPAFLKPWKKLVISGLNFKHDQGVEGLHHLRDVHLEIKAGQKIAFIGASGSGKTTLLTLMRGLYQTPKVHLSIDGESFDSLAPLSGFTTLIPQDSEIFENTVRYNLTFGIDISPQRIEEALAITTFSDVVPQLPQGIETDIRERGVNLSGGQKQRLALARGLIAARESSLLLLDEPTSSVDLATEKMIFDQLFASFADKTIIASVHRLHLLPRFDYIVLMHSGEIQEQGSFTDLLAKRGAFHKLWQQHH